MTVYAIGATSLIGGGLGALDAAYVDEIGSSPWSGVGETPGIHNGDTAFVPVQGDKIYHYIANSTSGAAESSPDIIKPDELRAGIPYTGDLRWMRHDIYKGTTVEKTISGGTITVTAGEKHIQLIGQGNVADTLTGITGGSEMDTITLWRKADLGYSIVISSDAGLHLQRNRPFTINANYDNITLVCKESNVWVEKGGRISAN